MATTKKKIADDRSIKDLTTVQHILLRPVMYLGSVVPTDKDAWILNSDDTISLKKDRKIKRMAKDYIKQVTYQMNNKLTEKVKTKEL